MTNKTSLRPPASGIRHSASGILHSAFCILHSSFVLRAAAFCILHSAFCITNASAVSITATATAVGAGDPTPVQATVSDGTVSGLVLVYRVTGSASYQTTWNTNEMTSVSATLYTGEIPPLSGSVNVEWYVTDGTVSSATTTTTLAALPDYNRYHDGKIGETQVVIVSGDEIWPYTSPSAQRDMVNGWKYDSGSYTNLSAQAPNGSKWKASGVCVATSKAYIGGQGIDTTIGMAYPSLYFLNLPPSEIPFIRSPRLYGGVGSIDFRTTLIGTTAKTSELTLQIAYTDQDPTEADWVDYAVYKYGTQNGNVFSKICHEVLNDYGVTYVRIVRTGHNIYDSDITSGRFAVDNICITKPAANVGIIEKLKNPGYPSSDQNILMRCAVTNVCADTPAINRRVSVKYQYVARDTAAPIASAYAWSSADMSYMGRDAHGHDWYEGTIPTQKVGYVWYYYQVDYDGYHYGDNPLTGASESISPAYWDAGEDTHVRPIAGMKFQVRPYRSRYGRVAIEASPADASIPEMTLVGDEQWQAVTLVNGISVVSNYFVGYGYYVDDAEEYEPDPVLWGENNPDALSDPTLAGFLESSHDTIVTNRLVALNEKNYTGFYLYRFSSNDLDDEARTNPDGDRRYDYIVKKAVYQDFDEWTASPDYYESSLGGLPTLTFTENFDGNAASAASGAICVTNAWYEDQYFPADYKTEDFQDEPLSDEFDPEDVKTERRFLRTGSRVLADRKAKNTETLVNKTMALNLHGRVQNPKDSIPYGLEKITFKARASVDDRNFAVFKDGSQWNVFPKYVSASWQLTDLAPSKPYFSYVLLYQPPTWGGASWYEVRIIQADSYNLNNDTVNIEVWRHKSDGTESRVGSRNNITGCNLKNSRTVNVLVDKNGSKLRFRVHLTGSNPSSVDNNSRANSAYIEDSSPINFTEGGAIGFGVFDAVPNISMVKAGTTNGGTDIISSLQNTANNWYDGGNGRWTITSGSITRPVPTQTIDIYAANCIGGESWAEPEELYKAASRTVSSLTMTDMTVEFKAWNKKFVQILYAAGDGGIVLDDIEYSPWRAVTRYNASDAVLANDVSYLDWTSVDQQNEWLNRVLDTTGENMKEKWAVLEGWTEKSGAFQIGANFDRTRANTNIIQGVVSPELVNGIGSCSFSYAASGGKVVYGVERSNYHDYNNWTPVAVYTNAAGQSGERYAKVGEYFSGRIRVRVYGAHEVSDLLTRNPDCGYDPAWGGSDDNAKLLIDNLRVKDYPEDVNDNAWNAYNLLITGEPAFVDAGLVFNNTGKSCFFNNNPTNGVYGAEEFTEDDPYLESPPLREVGVGEIAFQYRIVPGTAAAGTDAHIVVKVAPRRDTPLAEWKTITNLTISASGTAFVKFDNEKIFDERNFVVRFYNSKLPGTPRFVIDNVLVTAPARPSFEFEYVHLLPAQPLAGTNTAVEAKIMREIMNPKNIKVYVSYHKYDTNDVNDVWGVANWFDPLTSPKIELRAVGEKVYRTPDGTGIPDNFSVNDVVEFVVWGVHADINLNAGDTAIVQGRETFELPSWYRKLDLVQAEILPMDMNEDKALEGWSPYYWVFSCPPETFFVNEINNWYTASDSNDDYGSAEYIEFVGPAGTDISGWKLMLYHNGPEGNEFEEVEYVVPQGTFLPNDTPTGWGFFVWGDKWAKQTMRINAEFPDSDNPTDRNLNTYGGILVYRPNGMIEQMIRFGTFSVAVFNGEDFWDYAGRKDRYRLLEPLSLLSKVVEEDESSEVVAGRVASDFEWKQAYGTPAAVNGTGQVFADLGGDTPPVPLCYPDGTPITDEDVLDWIEHYSGTQEDIDALGTNAKVDEEFLLNLDLTKTCVAELKITSIRIEDGVVYLGVQLTRTENNVAVGTRKINGTLKLLCRADLTTGTFTALQPDAFDDNFETGNSIGIEYELPATNPPKFFKVIVE